MSRIAPFINCTKEELTYLSKIVSSGTSEQRLALRCKIILLSNENKQNKEISKELVISLSTTRKWRHRFSNLGIKGIFSRC